jgi:hypothetical protein
MADIVSFQKKAKAARQDKARGKTLCGRGFHKWAVDKTTRFDVKLGRLVTVERCERCGETRSRAT